MSVRLVGLVVFGVLLSGCSDDSDAPERAEVSGEHAWSYEDVDAWGGACASGTQQSPIDLGVATEADLVDLELDYHSSSAAVVDNGHSVQVDVADAGTMTRDGETYTLRQFHFHAPSEHELDGVPYAAEVHLVHVAEDESLAVLAILVEEGDASAVVGDVLDSVPEEGADPARLDQPVDVTDLLPADLRTFRYDGSLTTPPCSEGVAWSVLLEPQSWSADQIADFAALHPDSHRPPQPLGDRVVERDTT